MIESYQEKKTSYEKLTKSISIEKEILQSEISKETIDGIKTKELQNDAFLKEMDTNKDLKRADPALTSALAALDSLDRRELGSCKTINNGKFSSHSGEKKKNNLEMKIYVKRLWLKSLPSYLIIYLPIFSLLCCHVTYFYSLPSL